MPADITGTTVITEDQQDNRFFRFEQGPIFNNLVLADEINRATPKTQSALLEAMHERTVTVGNSLHDLPIPFFVMATQNPIEMEGTYPLPEAQLDRFFFQDYRKLPRCGGIGGDRAPDHYGHGAGSPQGGDDERYSGVAGARAPGAYRFTRASLRRALDYGYGPGVAGGPADYTQLRTLRARRPVARRPSC